MDNGINENGFESEVMNGVLIALKAGAFQYMAYGVSHNFSGYNVKIEDVPVLNIDDRLLIGINYNHSLLQYFRINKPKFTNLDYNSLVLGFNFLNDMEKLKHAHFMVVTISGGIYIWTSGNLYEIDKDYMAIGGGDQVALGCLYGTDHRELIAEERLETTLGAVHAYNPSFILSTGILKI